MVTAPKGINLRMAITQHLSQQQLEGSTSAPRGGVLHAHASVPGTPASLPCGLGSAAGTPMPASITSVHPGSNGQQQQGQQQQQQAAQTHEGQQAAGCLPGAGASHAAAPQQSTRTEDSATWQWLMQSRFASQPAGSSRAGQPPPEALHPGALPPQAQQPATAGSQGAEGASHQASAGGSASEESTAADKQARQAPRQQAPGPGQGQPSGLQRLRATTHDQLELLQDAAPAVRLDGSRPWTYDDAGGPAASAAAAAASRQRAQELEVEYRWRAAARMWPMLAPFVPRLLRQYLVQARPAASRDRWASTGWTWANTLCLRTKHASLSVTCGRAFLRCICAPCSV